MIKKVSDNHYVLKTQDGKHILGHHPSKAAAQRQETAINMSKARAAGHHLPPPPAGKK